MIGRRGAQDSCETGMAVHLSLEDPAYWERWEKEVLVGLQRQERRPRTPAVRPWRRNRHLAAESADDARASRAVPFRRRLDATARLELFTPTRRLPSRCSGIPGWRGGSRFGRRGMRLPQDPERAARRAVFAWPRWRCRCECATVPIAADAHRMASRSAAIRGRAAGKPIPSLAAPFRPSLNVRSGPRTSASYSPFFSAQRGVMARWARFAVGRDWGPEHPASPQRHSRPSGHGNWCRLPGLRPVSSVCT